MASTKEMRTKDGRRYFKISVSRGHGKSPFTKSWYPSESWAEKTVQRNLQKAMAEFEQACKNGEVQTRAEKKQKAAAEAAEKAKLRTVRQYSLLFMETKERSFSEESRASYQMFLDRHILPKLGDYLLEDVTTAMINKLLLDFQKKGYAHSTCVKLYNILNGLFTMAFLDYSIKENPMLRVSRPKQPKDKVQAPECEKALTLEQLKYCLACLDNEPLQWKVYITLSADTGARRGEMCGLQWSDIDWNKKLITISRTRQYTAQKGVYENPPKNGKIRTVDVGDETLELLRQLRKEQAAQHLSKWVFTQRGTAEGIFPQSPDRYFKKFSEKYNIPNFHPHLLRHTSATLAILNGADIVSVSARLGHSDTAVTLKMYSHANEESIRKAGQVVRDALKKES